MPPLQRAVGIQRRCHFCTALLSSRRSGWLPGGAGKLSFPSFGGTGSVVVLRPWRGRAGGVVCVAGRARRSYLVAVTMPVSVAGPVGSCFVCGTPRTGSSLLLGLLESTGVAGRPQAYFREPDEPLWADRWQVPDIANYYLAWGQQWPARGP